MDFRHLIGILLGLTCAGGVGYFVGFDHGFERAQISTPTIEWSSVGEAANVMSLIIGEWQSADDQKFARVIRNDGSVIDRSEGHKDTEGRWLISTGEIPEAAFPFTYEAGAVYMSLFMGEAEASHFKIVSIDHQSLQLIYLERGTILSFTRR